MSVQGVSRACFGRSLGSVEPLYFDAHRRRLFGWLHGVPEGSNGRLGAVICNPFGNEAICSYRSIRIFAQALAARGVPVLRFDYSGTGDSDDIDSHVDQLKIWTDDVRAAIGEIRRLTAVTHVCVIGFRLGATLATLAAARVKGAVEALVAVAPVVSGQRYLRELRTMRLASHGSDTGTGRSAALEVGGVSLSEAAVSTLRTVDLANIRPTGIHRALLIDRTDVPSADAWSHAFAVSGTPVRYTRQPGLVEMMMTTPHRTVVPHAVIDLACEWLSELQPALVLSAAESVEPNPMNSPRLAARSTRTFSTPTGLHLVTKASDGLARARERPVCLATEPALFGIVTEPRSGVTPRCAIILLNDSTTHHIGSNRMYVTLARFWAEQGYVVLRMDIAGVGDSATRPHRQDNDVFPLEAVDDIGAAVRFMRDTYNPCDIIVGGLCSGAYHSLRAAVAGLPVKCLLMINPENFFWNYGASLQDLQLAEALRNPRIYQQRLKSFEYWGKLLRGEVDILRILRIYSRRFGLMLEALFRDQARKLGIHLPKDLGRELCDLAARDIRMVFVFSSGEPGIELLRLQGGSVLGKLGDHCHIHVVDGADHVFSRLDHREALKTILTEEVASLVA